MKKLPQPVLLMVGLTSLVRAHPPQTHLCPRRCSACGSRFRGGLLPRGVVFVPDRYIAKQRTVERVLIEKPN